MNNFFLPWQTGNTWNFGLKYFRTVKQKTNNLVCSVFGRIYGAPICLRFYLTFMKSKIALFLTLVITYIIDGCSTMGFVLLVYIYDILTTSKQVFSFKECLELFFLFVLNTNLNHVMCNLIRKMKFNPTIVIVWCLNHNLNKEFDIDRKMLHNYLMILLWTQWYNSKIGNLFVAQEVLLWISIWRAFNIGVEYKTEKALNTLGCRKSKILKRTLNDWMSTL